MNKYRVSQNGFQSGELSPLTFAREDIGNGGLFRSAGKKIRNYIITASGAIRRRWGTEYVDTSNANVVFHPFVFDADERYLLVFDNAKFTAYSLDGSYDITDEGDTTSGAVWTTAMLPELVTTQTANTMIVTHEDMRPRVILRTGLGSFTISNFNFDNIDINGNNVPAQPYFNFSTKGTTLSFSDVTGTITVTSSTNLFDSSHVNSYWRVKHGANDWKYFQITAVTNATTATATPIGASLSSTAATQNFGEPAFSELRGYPRVCIFHSGRLWFFSTPELPNYVWASKSDLYFNFDDGEGLDGDAIFASIQSGRVNKITGASVVRHLHIFTDQAEFYVPTSLDEPVSPSNFVAVPQTRYGSKANVQPVEFDGASLYVQRNGKAIREFVFTDLEQAYSSQPISIIAEHLIDNPVRLSVVNGTINRQEQYCFICNEDGTIAVLQSIRGDNITNFSLWSTDGEYKTVCAVDEVVFALVKRTIDNSTVYYIEAFREDRYLDCSSVQTDTETTDWSGVTWLANTSVQVRSGKYYMGEYDVDASGDVTIDSAVESVEIGLPYTATFESMPVALASERGSFMGEIKRLTKVSVRFDSSVACDVDGTRLIVRNVTDDLSLEPTPFTGSKEFILSGYTTEGTFTIEQDLPSDLTVLGYNLEVMA